MRLAPTAPGGNVGAIDHGDVPDGTKNAQWSPDGERLAFIGRYVFDEYLMIAAADGSGRETITVADAAAPTWVGLWWPRTAGLELSTTSKRAT